MKIVWLSINTSYAHASLALPLLERAAAEEVEGDWRVVQATIHEKPARILEEILLHQPDILLATAYLFTIEPVLAVCERAKTISPNLRIVLGGPEFLGDNHGFLSRYSFVDAVVRGEGEAVVAPLLQAVGHPDKWREIPGVCCRYGNSEIHDDGRRAAELPMQRLPDPMDSPFFDWQGPFVQMETARGCRARCSFCTSAIGDTVRYLELGEIRGRLEKIRAKGIREIRILDRSFNHPAERAEELLKSFLTEFPDLHFHLEIYPNLLNDAVLDVIRQAKPGQLHLEVGLQSSHPAHLLAVKRAPFGSHARHMLECLCEIETVPVHVDLLVGLPGQTLGQIQEDLRMLGNYCPDEVQVETLKILKGTPIETRIEALNLSYSPTPPYEVLCTGSLRFSDIQQAMRYSRILDGFYNTPGFQPLMKSLWKQHPDLFEALEKYLEAQSIDVGIPMSLKNRFACLHHFLETFEPSGADDLEVRWIKNGFSPLKGLGDTELWKQAIPDDAVCRMQAGDPDVRRDARTYHLRQRTRDYWMQVFRRRQQAVDVLGEWERTGSGQR